MGEAVTEPAPQQAISLRLDTTPWKKGLDALGKRAPIALARALNRTGNSERTAMARAVAADMGIKVGTARDAIKVEKATARTLVTRVIAKGKRLPLIDLKARGPYPSRGRGRGVSYVSQGGQRKSIANAFIAVVRRAGQDGGEHEGHKGVFIRPGKRRLPIKQLYGASIARSFGNQIPTGEARRNEVLVANVQHEIEYELSRLNSTGA
jgi:hypothetical protein